MTEESAPGHPKTISDKLAERPRARIFTVFTLLGFIVTPVAITILLTQPAGDHVAGGSAIRLEAVVAAVLIAAHFVCAFFAWRFWKNEVPKPRSEPTDD